MEDFAIRYARIYPGVNSRAELVTLAPGLRPERRFATLARGLDLVQVRLSRKTYVLGILIGLFLSILDNSLGKLEKV